VDLVLLLDHDAEIATRAAIAGRAEVRVGVAVARRVGGAEQIVGVEIRAQGARGLRVEQLDLQPRLCWSATLRGDGHSSSFPMRHQIAVLAEVGSTPNSLTEALVGDDAVRGRSTPRRFAYWWRSALASAVEPEQTVSRSRRSPDPHRAGRW